MKYNKKEYAKYIKELKEDIPEVLPISFKYWKEFQPIADEVAGITNKITKKNIKINIKIKGFVLELPKEYICDSFEVVKVIDEKGNEY